MEVYECGVALTLPQMGRVFGGEVRLGKTVKDELEIGRILHLIFPPISSSSGRNGVSSHI
jgi:hypothetical protein